MDDRSEANLAQVEPKLGDVIRAAAQSPQPFVVIYGIRTAAEEAALVAEGHSETLHSRHLPDRNDLSAAVDVTPIIDGELSFAAGHEAQVYGQIAAQIKAAATALNVPIMWGGDAIGAWVPGKVSHFRDWGHFQLPWAYCP